MVVSNSTSLLSLLDSYEGMINVVHRHNFYTLTYPFADADVQNLAWLFTYGMLDGWTDRIAPYYGMSSRDYMHVNHTEMAILRMSAALRVLPRQEEDKVKYVIVCQNRDVLGSYKLLVSYSRKAVGMDIFYELLKGNSVVFIGLVLKHVAVPVEAPHSNPPIRFTRVDSVKAAMDIAEMEDRRVGILC